MATLTKQQFQERITEIGTCDDEAQRRVLLASLSEDGSSIYDEFETSETARAAADNECKNLREANMKLFLQIGDHAKPQDTPKTKTETPELKFEDLFDEKGRLK